MLSTTDSANTILDKIADQGYDSSKNFGFKIVEDQGKAISAYLVEKRVIKKRTYDEELDQVINVEAAEKKLIPFYIDLDREIIEVYSDQSNTKKVTTRIGEITEWSVAVKDDPLNLVGVYQYFDERNNLSSVSSLRISEFEAGGSISGTFTVKSAEDPDLENLIFGNKGRLTVLRLDLKIESTSIKIGFYRSGSVRIYSSIKNDEEVWQVIRTAIMTVLR